MDGTTWDNKAISYLSKNPVAIRGKWGIHVVSNKGYGDTHHREVIELVYAKKLFDISCVEFFQE
jgi:hypothetical protein